MYRKHDWSYEPTESDVSEMIIVLRKLEGQELSNYLDRLWDKHSGGYRNILGAALEDIEEESEQEYRDIEAKLAEMTNFNPRRVRSMVECSDEENYGWMRDAK